MTKLRPFCMPKWGIEMTEGTVAEWMVTDGDRVSRGDVICLIETAKITNEVEAEGSEIILRIVSPAGSEALPVGALLAVVGEDKASAEEIDAFVADYVPSDGGISDTPVAADPGANKPAPKKPGKIDTNRPISPKALDLAEREAVDLAMIEGSGRGGRITYQDVYQHLQPQVAKTWRGPLETPPSDLKVFASPLARRLAAIHGVKLADLVGTGPRGRISKHDVLTASGSVAPAAATVFAAEDNAPAIEPFDKIRTVIARRLTAAKRDIPHFYLRISADADALLALRKAANMVLAIKASLNDYVVMAVARALALHPGVNVQVHDVAVHRFAHADVAIAVASPKGLVTPIIRQADAMSISQIAAASAALIDKAKTGKLAYADLDGGTFTVSNLGMFGIDDFDAVINPPQGAILAVGRARREAVETADGDLAFATRIALSLSVDHRAIDGAEGAKFLATLKSLIEYPESLFS
ncbi:2-oxo acid dehydrogenase subunit E2 [Novosphingobium sp.]|uniref:2-oxo acid dehydrogenase subunit E2 n=1 Tax=Novosphingobium sp. TaxID=1874826 RepID=UPI0025EB93E7|nr:2-oxo acid dehydrogenase subunit E2 [Novosphingobium sp.]